MSVAIAGMGWVTPLGNDIAAVWQRLHKGDSATAETLSNPFGRSYSAFKVPAQFAAAGPVHPRLRRTSAISRFAVAAGLAALENAETPTDFNKAGRGALVLAVSNGGVIYTRKFYAEIVESGGRAASPLLFPETVFNAPASHLAAILGITGATYTVVGDGAVGILALKMAEELMEQERLDYCLVIGSEETDWLLCDAYRQWRLMRRNPPIEPFKASVKGTILSEGAGAILLGRSGAIQLEKIVAGSNFFRQSDARYCVEKVFEELAEPIPHLVVASANGTFIDAAEHSAVLRYCPFSNLVAIKKALGESVGASGLWQVICGAQILLTRSVPAELTVSVSGEGRGNRLSDQQFERVLVSVCGLNQQVAGLTLVRAS